jgi:hypothetical protein
MAWEKESEGVNTIRRLDLRFVWVISVWDCLFQSTEMSLFVRSPMTKVDISEQRNHMKIVNKLKEKRGI